MLLWSGQVVTTLGAQASSIIYPLLILALTSSPAQASLATALRIVPYLLLSLPVGALIDRWDRRRVMIVCHVARGAAIATLPLAMAFDALTVAHIYVVAVLEGALHVFFNIAETAALPRVVDKAELPQATAQNQAGFAAATVVGPALGTWLYQVAGKGVPFVVDTVTHVLGALALWRMRTSFTPAPVIKRPDLRAEVVEGLRWLWHHRLIRDMALITGGLNFLSTATPLLLIVLAKEQGASEAQIGLVFSIGGLGAILGALVGGQIQRRCDHRHHRAAGAAVPVLCAGAGSGVAGRGLRRHHVLRAGLQRRAVQLPHLDDPRQPAGPGEQRLPADLLLDEPGGRGPVRADAGVVGYDSHRGGVLGLLPGPDGGHLDGRCGAQGAAACAGGGGGTALSRSRGGDGVGRAARLRCRHPSDLRVCGRRNYSRIASSIACPSRCTAHTRFSSATKPEMSPVK